MDRKYWERIAPVYDDEIFDLLKNDSKSLVRKAIRKLSSPSHVVNDIGCGIGKWLPLLSPAFKKVNAIDISAENLRIAAATYPQFKNVKYIRANMSSPAVTSLPKSDLVICINAILTGSLPQRSRFFKTMAAAVKNGGSLVLTVPSLESSMLTSIIGHQWKIERDLLSPAVNKNKALHKWNNLQQGNADIDNVPTKHYLKEELQLLLSRLGFTGIEFKKIEYDWDTEFLVPPSWLKDPRPWDWLVVCRKN
ncbi:MAG TPA: class I SAM-dependent methyltransferase [Chitinophagaceae bacterium]|nr:class I SAM-dependent methyltransferase [Chitinophagaceae bacterium]